jgi:hypothetical protein
LAYRLIKSSASLRRTGTTITFALVQVVASCANADFYFSAMLRDDDFQALIESGSESMMTAGGTSEFAGILQIFERRRSATGTRPKFAGPNRVVWERGPDYVRSLSPSDDGIAKSLKRIAQQLPEARLGKRRIGDVRPNEASVVLLLRVGNRFALLGGDLEKQRDPAMGWIAVLGDWGPRREGRCFKIPHHGSENADEPEVWVRMLEDNPLAILTPFVRSSLPKPSDVARICSRTDQAYMTAPNAPGTRRQRSATVERTIEGVVRCLHDAEPPTGHVRLRARVTDDAPWSA